VKPRLFDAQVRHARLIAKCMRPKDIAEVRAGWSREPYEAIREAMSASFYARTLFAGFEPLCIFGLAPLTVLGGTARVWMFASAAIDRHPRAFARASREHLRELFTHCTLATNLVDTGDAAVMRWLQWLGGTCVLPGHERGGRLFAQFILVDRKPVETRECRQG
jgi:hypothetical protein